MYAAAREHGTEWVVIKGVSDFADGCKQKTNDWQSFSSVMAASVVKNMFKNPDVIKTWPGPGETKSAEGSYIQTTGYSCAIVTT